MVPKVIRKYAFEFAKRQNIKQKFNREVGMACQNWFLVNGFSAVDAKNGATKCVDMGGRKGLYMCDLCVSHQY